MYKKIKKMNNSIQSLNQLTLPPSGKFFNGKPTLKSMNIFELEYLKIKAPFKLMNSTSLFIPLKPKKIKYTEEDVKKENSSNVNYIIKKTKVFSPEETTIKNISSLLIERQPKKTTFEDVSQDRVNNIEFSNIPKKTSYDNITIENFPDIFIPDNAKKKYLSAMNIETMSIQGEKGEYCLEIDPNEEIFIPNVYDMLLIQNFWDDLEVSSFRFVVKPFGMSSRTLGLVSNKNLQGIDKSKQRRDSNEIIEKKEENQENEDVFLTFRNLSKDKEKKGSKPDNSLDIYEDKDKDKDKEKDKDKNEENKENVVEQGRPKGINKKGVSFKDLKDKLMMLNND